MALQVVENWKPILGSLAAALVVVLQIIQILIGSHIDGVLTEKTRDITQRGEALAQQLAANGQVSQGNAARLDQLKAEIARLEQDLGHGH